MHLILIILGSAALILGGHLLLNSSVSLSLRLKISKMIIGMTVVSFATSAPELIVSINSAIAGHSDLALANVVGSNIANLGLVLAVVVLLAPITILPSFFKTDWPILMMASVLLYGFLISDYTLSRGEGMILFSLLLVFLVYLIRFQKQAVQEDHEVQYKQRSWLTIFVFLISGGVLLWGGSELLIKGAIGIAHKCGVSERIIGITIVSLGTSVPEMAASVIAIIKKERAISLGNLIGSNIFNILGVLGITAIIEPIHLVDSNLIRIDIYWMLGFASIILPLAFLPKRQRLWWKEGGLLLALYLLFLYFLV